MSREWQWAGKTVLVTGAASGIGRALGRALAARGAALALADIDAMALADAAVQLKSGVRISTHVLDVADAAAVAALPAQIRAAHGRLDVLVNNAGMALGGTFDEIAPGDFERLFDVNFWSVVRMTRAFLPMLREAPEGWIVNMSSLFGLIAPGGQTAYAASKFAVRGFSNALAVELAGGSVGLTLVHPGGVRTNIANNAVAPAGLSEAQAARRRAQMNRALRLPPSAAAEVILAAVARRRRRVLVGDDARLLSLVERLAPVGHVRWLIRLHARLQRSSVLRQ